MAHLRRKKIFCYGFLAWPLSFIGLSLFIYIPKIYHEQYGISVAMTGTIFLITKFVNLSMIPFIGIWLDKINLKRIYRKKAIYVCLPLTALFFHFLIFPPSEYYASMIFFYLAACALYSVVATNYYAMSVEIAHDYNAQNHLSGTREMFSLFGFLTATLFPTVLTDKYSFKEAYDHMIFVYMAILITGAVLLHFVKAKPSFMFHPELNIKKVWDIAVSRKYSRFLLILLLNGISQGLIATTALFYIKYVIQADSPGCFLLIYYLTAIVSIPFWVRFSLKSGKKNAWMISMVLFSFISLSSFFLGEGDNIELIIVFFAIGFCLGADMLLSTSLFADNVRKIEKAATKFSLWLLMNKIALTICVLVSLSTLGFYGLEAGDNVSPELQNNGIATLSLLFCIMPAIFKIFSLALLSKAKIDHRFGDDEEEHFSILHEYHPSAK